MFVVCAQAQAQNATGAPAVTAADSADLTMVGPNEDRVLTAAQGTIDDDDGITTFTPTWAWYEADAPASGTPMDSAYSAIAGATAAEFIPLQEHVGKFVRVCATFDDDKSNEETRCWTSVAAVTNFNDVNPLPSSVDFPVGRISRFRLSDFRHEDEGGDDYPSPVTVLMTRLPANGTLTISGLVPTGAPASVFASEFISANGFTYTPPANATVGTGYDIFNFEVFVTGYGAGPAAAMTINLVANSAPDFGDASVTDQLWLTAWPSILVLPRATGGNNTAYSISPALPAGLSFDAVTAAISGMPTAVSAMTQYTYTATDADGETDTLTFRAAVSHVSDQPIGGPSTVGVPITASSAEPHRFAKGDFPFADEGGDTINGIRITALPTTGTLALADDADTAIAVGTELTLGQLNNLAYYPADGATATTGYATFGYRVRDTGDVSAVVRACDPRGFCTSVAGSANEAAADSTLTIDLVNLPDSLRLRLRLFLEGPLR